MKKTIKVFTVYKDGGDGSATSYLYNNESEAMSVHNKNNAGSEFIPQFKSVEEWKEWMDDDPYERGSYGWDELNFEVTLDGDIKLFVPEGRYRSNNIYSHNQ